MKKRVCDSRTRTVVENNSVGISHLDVFERVSSRWSNLLVLQATKFKKSFLNPTNFTIYTPLQSLINTTVSLSLSLCV